MESSQNTGIIDKRHTNTDSITSVSSETSNTQIRSGIMMYRRL